MKRIKEREKRKLAKIFGKKGFMYEGKSRKRFNGLAF